MGTATFLQHSFIGGEWAPSAQGNIVDPLYKVSLSTCLNSMPREDGAWTRRGGTRHAFTTRGGGPAAVIGLDFKDDTPYTMEFTDGFLRFRDGPALVLTNDAQAVVSITSLAISAYNAASTYAAGDFVSYDGYLWYCVSPITPPPAYTPGTNEAYWLQIGVLDTASIAIVTTTTAHGWLPGNSVMFSSLGVNNPALQNKVLEVNAPTTTTLVLLDPITRVLLDTATIGTFTSGTVSRILELETVYTAGQWSTARSIQAETRSVFVNGQQQPQLLVATTSPLPGVPATFTLNPFNFIDGPYLDPVPGSYVTPSAQNGVITLTLTTQAYDATRAYNIGDLVTASAISYRSLQGNNQNHTPASSASWWEVVNAGAAIGPNGFVASDVGRHIRLYSQPVLYDATQTYTTGTAVSFPSTTEGINLYYTATASVSAGEAPGSSTKWALTPTAALWTWGVVQSVSGTGLITPDTAIGDFDNFAAAFNGTTSQNYASSAAKTQTFDAYYPWVATSGYPPGSGVYYAPTNSHYACLVAATVYDLNSAYSFGTYVSYLGSYYVSTGSVSPFQPPGAGNWAYQGDANPTNVILWQFVRVAPAPTYARYVGQHFSSPGPISQVTIYPTANVGFSNTTGSIAIAVRGKHTAPANSSDGTVLAGLTTANTTSPIGISISPAVSWEYIWVEMLVTYPSGSAPNNGSTTLFTSYMGIGQILFFEPDVENGSVITAQIQGDALLYTSTIRTWRLGVYSDTTGWPTTGVYHEGRLWLAGAIGNRIDSSKSNDIFNFAPTSKYGEVADNHAISYTFNSRDVNTIFWMEQDQAGIICGTQGGEWLVQATTVNAVLTPTTIQAHRVTKIGCANIEPKRCDHTIVFAQKQGRKNMEYFADVFSGKFSAPNLLKNASHLATSGIVELEYQQGLVPTLWSRMGDGSLIGNTYKRDNLVSSQGPNINGVHRHILGSGRIIESMCIGRSAESLVDALTVVTNDTVTGVRNVEVMTDIFQEGDALQDAWHLDNAAAPSSYATGTVAGGAPGVILYGLHHLNGKTVTVFAGGLDLGDWPVTDGAASIPFAPSTLQTNTLFTAAFVSGFAGAMPCVVGFTYASRGQLLRPDTQPEGGARNGPGFGKVRRIHKYAALLVNTQAISFGTAFDRLKPAILKTPGGTAVIAANALFSGIHKDTMNDAADGFSSQLCWEVSRPFPATIGGISGFLDTTDE